MKTYTFPCYANAGKCDSTDFEMDFDVTEEQEQLMIDSIKSGAWSLSEDERLTELYDSIVAAILEDNIDYLDIDTEDMIDFLDFDTTPYEDENGDIDEDALSEEIMTDENKKDYLWNMYTYGVGFPQELFDKYQ